MIGERGFPRPSGLSTLALAAIAGALALLLGFWVAADALLVPKVAAPGSHAVTSLPRPSGWISVGGPDPQAGPIRSIAQVMPPPIQPVRLDRIVVRTLTGAGSAAARLFVSVYETSQLGPTGQGRLVSAGTIPVSRVGTGLVGLDLVPAVLARPGRWYTFVFRATEPGSTAAFALVPGPGAGPASLWTLDQPSGGAAPRPEPGLEGWQPAAGTRLLLLLQY